MRGTPELQGMIGKYRPSICTSANIPELKITEDAENKDDLKL